MSEVSDRFRDVCEAKREWEATIAELRFATAHHCGAASATPTPSDGAQSSGDGTSVAFTRAVLIDGSPAVLRVYDDHGGTRLVD